jgi:hypothetical protein
MRFVVALSVLLVLPVAACVNPPVYENPKLQGKIERLWKERDDCLLANAPQMDDRTSDPHNVARLIAKACGTQTTRLLDMSVPEPDQKARDAFQAEAERRAADIVVTFRRLDASAAQSRQPRVGAGEPTPLQ